MKCAVILCMLVFASYLNAFAAEETKGGGPVGNDKKVKTEEGSAKLKHIDVDVPSEKPIVDDDGVSKEGVMEPYESYDENTGLPNVVQSDEEGNLN